ncbi:MAG: hypothetical protein JJU36_04275 [Phycisphaeraceae bacterium]|nr:hypothetical protein [Phycisphaeraceae bacterium]
MLKFFRTYNKYILAVGMALLMVAFLIGPALETAGRGAARVQREEAEASAQIQLLQELDRLVVIQMREGSLPERDGLLPFWQARLYLNRMDLDRDPTSFRLIQREMELLGIGASRERIARYLGESNIGFDGLQRIARQRGIPFEMALDALGTALAVPDYFYAVTGFRAHEAFAFSPEAVNRLLHPAAVKRLAMDREPTTAIRALPIPLEPYLEAASEAVTDEKINELFERFKDVLPGEGHPAVLGYAVPRAVKLEWIEIPWDQVRRRITAPDSPRRITMADIRDVFEAGPMERFSDSLEGMPADSEADPDLFASQLASVERRIRRELETRAARELSQSIGRMIEDMVKRPENRLQPLEGRLTGYRVVDEDFEPVSLDEVAREIQRREGVLPNVERRDRDWLTPEQWARVNGLGPAALELDTQRGVSFVQYLASTIELLDGQQTQPPEVTDRNTWESILTFPLQRGLISHSLRDVDDNRFYFRVIDARPRRAAELDEVRDQVRADAIRLEAFRLAKADKETWLSRTREVGMRALAEESNAPLIATERFARRATEPRFRIEWRAQTDEHGPPLRPTRIPEGYFDYEAPPIHPRINADRALVDAIIDFAEEIGMRGGLGVVPHTDRFTVLPHEEQLTLWAVEITEFWPLTDFELDDAVLRISDPRSEQTMLTIQSVTTFKGLDQVFSRRAIAKRIGEELPEFTDDDGID